MPHISKAMYYRLMIPDLLPQFEKVIYLDCDLVIKKSLAKLYSFDMCGNWLAGVLDYPDKTLMEYVQNSLEIDSGRYVNTGVLLIDCKAFEKNHVANQCVELLE